MENQGIASLAQGLVSVIVPCYNYGHYLPATLESVLEQSHQHWECIIVDDGSTDNTAAVAHQYVSRDRRFVYIYQHNKGLSAARNTGIRRSSGQYLQFLDSDDMIEPRKLEKQVNAFSLHPEADVVFVDVKLFADAGDAPVFVDPTHALQRSGKGEEIVRCLLAGEVVVVNAPLVRKATVEEVGWFNEKLITSEDYDFWLRCALHDKQFYYLKDENVCALVRKGHQSMSRNLLRMLVGSLNMLEGLRGCAKQRPYLRALLAEKQKAIKRLYGTQMFKAAVYSDFNNYAKQLMKAFYRTKDLYFLKLYGRAVCAVSLRNAAGLIRRHQAEATELR